MWTEHLNIYAKEQSWPYIDFLSFWVNHFYDYFCCISMLWACLTPWFCYQKFKQAVKIQKSLQGLYCSQQWMRSAVKLKRWSCRRTSKFIRTGWRDFGCLPHCLPSGDVVIPCTPTVPIRVWLCSTMGGQHSCHCYSASMLLKTVFILMESHATQTSNGALRKVLKAEYMYIVTTKLVWCYIYTIKSICSCLGG